MKKITKNILEYTVLFEPAEEGGYIVTVPALDGCATQGETIEEAVRNIKEAISGVIAVMEEEGLEIPREKTETFFTKIAVSYPVLTA
ncbi:MAG: type II toxin-antitoxin system HicB family antitoxin [Patescibacteria group bacterium]